MQCPSCSAEIRPVVAIDLDGTLANYHGHLSNFAEQWLDTYRTIDSYDGSEPFKEWFCRAFRTDVTTFRAIKLAYRQGGQKRAMPTFTTDDVAAFSAGVTDAGASLWITTTRPWDRFDRVDPDTREWLRRNGVGFDGLLYDSNKMARLAESVDPATVVAVLDDQLDILEAADRAGWNPILRRTTWNRAVEWDGDSVHNLSEALDAITMRIDEWRDQHEV